MPGITVDTAGWDRQNRSAISGSGPRLWSRILFRQRGHALDDLFLPVPPEIEITEIAGLETVVLRDASR